MVQLICELLVNGTPPTAIPGNISAMYESLYGEEPDEAPSISFCRHCRVTVQVVGETMAALKLASAEEWKQLFTDATTRRQISFQCLLIGVMDGDDKIDPVVVSLCIFMEDESSETEANSILDKVCLFISLCLLSDSHSYNNFAFILFKINSLKDRLDRLREVVEKKHPGKGHLVPSADEINTDKLAKATVMTDTCSAAQKVRRVLCAAIPGMHEFDCMQHLRNVWIGGMEKAVTGELNKILRDSLDEIDPTIRVTSSISAIIRAIDKEFSLSANYPKGHGDLFAEWMLEKYPGALLLHVERAAGSRQDLCTEGCLPIIQNYPFYLEFLDWTLRKTNTSDKASILQRNLFVALGSVEMIALARFMSIIHVSVSMPFRWLAGKTHKLAEYDWGPMSMARVIDTLREKMSMIAAKPSLIHNEGFMLNIFEKYRLELPPFQEYWDEMFTKKRVSVVNRKSGTKELHFDQIKKVL